MDEKFVNAYVIATGEKQRIPAHWLDHPTLGAPFRLTPSARAAEQRTPATQPAAPVAPTSTDVTSTPASTTPPNPNPLSTTETPAAGAKE